MRCNYFYFHLHLSLRTSSRQKHHTSCPSIIPWRTLSSCTFRTRNRSPLRNIASTASGIEYLAVRHNIPSDVESWICLQRNTVDPFTMNLRFERFSIELEGNIRCRFCYISLIFVFFEGSYFLSMPTLPYFGSWRRLLNKWSDSAYDWMMYVF